MSNRSEENKGGILNGEVLKSFFSVTGEPGSFVHTPGHERIPNNCKYQKNLLSILPLLKMSLRHLSSHSEASKAMANIHVTRV